MLTLINYKEQQNKITIAIIPVEISEKVNINNLVKALGKIEEGLWLQLVDTKAIFSFRHLIYSSYISLRRYLNSKTLTKNPHIEVLMLITGTRQIEEALAKAGICDKTRSGLLIALSLNKREDYVIETIKSFIKKHKLIIAKEKLENLFNEHAPIVAKVKIKELKSTIGLSYFEKLEKNIMLNSLSIYFKF